MTPERWQDVERAYLAALACEEARRAATIDEVCAADAELRHEVETLLAQEARVERFLESPPWLGSAPPDTDAEIEAVDQDAPSALAPSTTRDVPSVGVLPFADVSRNRSCERLAEGMAEGVMRALSRMAGLRVVSPALSIALAGQGIEVREIGRRLDVRAVLDGSVRAAGSRFRVTAHLVDVESGLHLWSERSDVDAAGASGVHGEIAEAIAAHVRPTVDGGG